MVFEGRTGRPSHSVQAFPITVTIPLNFLQISPLNARKIPPRTTEQAELRESIWLVNMELRNGLPRYERIETRQEIAEMETALKVLLDAAEAGP